MTFKQAQEAFKDDPSIATAADYLDAAMEYESIGAIGDDTFFNALADVCNFLQELEREYSRE